MYMRRALLSLSLVIVTAVAAPAATKPIPGGANQMTALSGKIGQTLWNGMVRLTVSEVRDASPADHPESVVPLATQKVMVLKGVLRNGLSREFGETLDFTLADKDDVAVPIHGSEFKNSSAFNVQQGAAARFGAVFAVDKEYAPTKLLVACSTCGNGPANKFKAFRITLTP